LRLIKYSSDLRYVDPFRIIRDQNRKLSNRAEFWTFFSPSQISGGRPSKSYTHFITPTSRYVAWKKFCQYTPISPEVIVANTLNFKPNFKFSRLNFFGDPLPVRVCVSKAWSICNACKNLRGSTPQAQNVVSQKCPFDLVNMSNYNVFVCGPMFTHFLSLNVEGVVVDKILFRFAICRSVLEIFAIKVESSQKSHRILDVFSPSQILGGRPYKSYTHFITPTSQHVA